MELGFVLSALRRRLWIVALCTIVGVVASLQIKARGATEYEAQAVLLVTPPVSAAGTQNFGDPDRYVATQLSALKNAGLESKVSSELGGGLSTDAIDLAVRVQQRPKTSIVDVFATADTPEAAQNLATTYVKVYMADLIDKVKKQTSPALDAIEKQLATVNKQIEDLDTKIGARTVPNASIVPPDVQAWLSQRNSLAKQQDNLVQTQTNLQLAEVQQVTSEIQQEAILPQAPKAKSKKLVIAGMLGGPMLGLALALAVARFSSKVVDTSQVEDVLGQPTAVRLRRLRGMAAPKPELIRSLPLAAEGAIDLLCVRAEANASPTSALRVAVVGTERGAGSTTLAAAIAGRFARKGSTVVLVDADQNDPEVSEVFHTGGDAGLPALLARVDRISEIKMTGQDRRRGTSHAGNRPVFTTVDPDIRVLGLGPKLGQTVLRRSNVPALLERLANEAQVIVIDAGPLLDAATTVQLSLAVDAVVLAVPYRRQRLSSLEAVARQLASREGELLPVITSPHRRHKVSRAAGAPQPTIADVTDEARLDTRPAEVSSGTASAAGQPAGADAQRRRAVTSNILDAREARVSRPASGAGNGSGQRGRAGDEVSEPTVSASTTDD